MRSIVIPDPWGHRARSRRWRLRFLCALALLVLASPQVAGAASVELVFTGTSGSGTPGGSTITAQPGDTLSLDIVVTPGPNGVSSVSLSLEFDPSVVQPLSVDECPAPPNPLSGLCSDGSIFANPFTAGAGSPGGAPTQILDCNEDGAVGVPDWVALHEWVGTTVPPAPAACDPGGWGWVPGGSISFSQYANSFGWPGVPAFVPGRIQIIEAHPGSELSGSYTLARVAFEVVGSGSSPIEVFYLPKLDGIASGDRLMLADATDPTGVPVTNAMVNPVSVPALPLWGAALTGMAGLGVAGVAFRRRRGADRRRGPRAE